MSTGVLAPSTISDKAKSWVDLCKDGLTLVRDLFLSLLFVGFLFFPKHLNKALSRAGITTINGGVFEWQSKVKDAASKNATVAQDTSQAASTLQEVRDDLQTIATSSSDAATRQAATQAANKIDGTLSSLDKANNTLASTYLLQQGLLQSPASGSPSAGTAAAVEGWVNVGRADESGQAWATPPSPKISGGSPVLKVGESVTLTEDVFVRGDKPGGGGQRAVVGAVRGGTTLQVLDVQTFRAKRGGELVWVKIKAPPGK